MAGEINVTDSYHNMEKERKKNDEKEIRGDKTTTHTQQDKNHPIPVYQQ